MIKMMMREDGNSINLESRKPKGKEEMMPKLEEIKVEPEIKKEEKENEEL